MFTALRLGRLQPQLTDNTTDHATQRPTRRPKRVHAALPELALRRRDLRVVVLVIAIVAMSAGDLYMTVTFLTHGGMIESNPFARAVILQNSPAMLALWKGTTVAMAASILLYARRRGSAELAAWIGVATMTMLTIHWLRYIDETAYYTQMIAMAQHCPDLQQLVGEDWISID